MASSPKSVAIIGASGGIGISMAERIAQDAAVTLGYRNSKEPVHELALKIESNGGRAILHQVDVTDSQSVKEFLLAAETQWGRLDSIVVATGPKILIGPILDISLETFKQVIETEVYGAFNIVKSGCEILKRQPGSNKSILFILSCSLRRTIDFDGMSYIPKMAVEGLIRQTVREGGKDGIRLNGIGLGGFATGPGPITNPSMEDEFVTSVLANVQTPSGRFGTGDEIASLGAFLLSDGATYINGQIIGADGGYSA